MAEDCRLRRRHSVPIQPVHVRSKAQQRSHSLRLAISRGALHKATVEPDFGVWMDAQVGQKRNLSSIPMLARGQQATRCIRESPNHPEDQSHEQQERY